MHSLLLHIKKNAITIEWIAIVIASQGDQDSGRTIDSRYVALEIETVVIGIASVVNKADTGSVFIKEEVKRIGYQWRSGLGIDHPVNDGIIHGGASTMLPDAITVSVIGKVVTRLFLVTVFSFLPFTQVKLIFLSNLRAILLGGYFMPKLVWRFRNHSYCTFLISSFYAKSKISSFANDFHKNDFAFDTF